MPHLHLHTNKQPADSALLLADLSELVVRSTGKPEKYVCVTACYGEISFSGSSEPAAVVQLAAIALQEQNNAAFSAELSELLESTLGIPPDRIYVRFDNYLRNNWGFNGTTFG